VNDFGISIVLGVIEGLTEFLPISSTAHLRISEALLHVSLTSGYWKMYTVVIQLGAILCLPVYFWPRLVKFVSTYPRGEDGTRTWLTHPLGLTVVAFFVTAIPAFLLTKVIGKNLENLRVMGWSLLVGGVVMWAVDAWNDAAERQGQPVVARTAGSVAAHNLAVGTRTGGRITTWRMEAMSLAQAAWIGACQILSAVFPGVSRSMATIAAGQVAGMSRASALEFSFFLSMPTMAAATGYDLLKSVTGRGENPIGVSQIDAHGWLVLLVGAVVSFIVAYAAVAWFMAWVRSRGFTPFAIYRIAIGALVLLFASRLAG
jgi:undecaprenyl-diphosphatase